MASSSCSPLQQALEQLKSAFQAAGCEGVPCGLQHLLLSYARGHADTPDGHEDARKRLYRCLYSLLWFGSNQTLGKKAGYSHPTYIFPSALKAVVRARFPKCVKDYSDPDGPQVYKLTYKDIAAAKWPATPHK